MASSSQVLEHQLDTLWEECHARNTRRIDEIDAEISASVEHDLHRMKHAIDERVMGAHSGVQEQLVSVAALTKRFEAAGANWRAAAQTTVREIGHEQQELARQLAEAQRSIGSHKEELRRRQQQRLAALEHSCNAMIDAASARVPGQLQQQQH